MGTCGILRGEILFRAGKITFGKTACFPSRSRSNNFQRPMSAESALTKDRCSSAIDLRLNFAGRRTWAMRWPVCPITRAAVFFALGPA
jgi:hypothetical protein